MSINQATKRNFEIIDAMPGAGKTEFFVTTAVKQLAKPRERILIYVAPTIQLLAETLCRIALHPNLPRDRALLKRIHVVCDHASNQKFTNFCRMKEVASSVAHCPEDAPAVALNYLLGLTTDDEYANTKYGSRSSFSKSMSSPALVGDIILTTHEAFVRVHNYDSTGRDFAMLKKATVVFDEARHCVIGSQEIQLEPEDRLVLMTKFNLAKPEARDKKEPYFLQPIDRVDSMEDIMDQLKVSRPSLVPAAIRKLAKQFDDYSKTGRAVIYILSAPTMEGYGIPKTRHTIFTLLRPTALFNHYAKVYLTSAFFTDSQMYHFLKKDGHTFTDMMKGAYPKGTPLYNIQRRDKALRANIFKRLECAVLLSSSVINPRSNYRDMLTSYLLKEGVLVPTAKHDYISYHLDPKLTLQGIGRAVIKGEPVSRDAVTTKILKSYSHPPLWIMLRAVSRIYLDWQERFEVNAPALLTINADRSPVARWQPSGMGYLRVLRSMYEDGFVVRQSEPGGYEDGSELSSDEMLTFDNALSPGWDTFFKKYVYYRSPSRLFIVPRSPKLHGVNTYSNLNAFVHLAALNPDPKLIYVYNKLLPDYIIDQDHAIENLVQMMYRTSLRKPDATEPVLLVVPYQAALDLLAVKIGDGTQSFKVDYPPQLMPLSYRRPISADDLESRGLAGAKVAAERRQKYSPEDRNLSRSLLTMLARKRKKQALKPTPALVKDIAQLEVKLAELQRNFKTGGL